MSDIVTHETYASPGVDLSPLLTGRTQLVKATLTQEVRVVLPKLPRRARVTIMSPGTPVTYMAIDQDIRGQNGVGYNRQYKMSVMAPSHPVDFDLAEGQWIIAACSEGTSDMSIIVEPR